MPPAQPHSITVALEGGGSLGAFAWGVLDRLVDVPGIRIAAVSGTSAGAVNAALLVQGLATGGPTAAKRLLETFWHRVALASGSMPGPLGAWLHMVSGAVAPVVDAVRQTTAAWSPGVGPNGANPMRAILNEMLDPCAFTKPDAPGLVVAATSVRTGEARLFRGAEVSVDALLASACLPQLFPAVEIDGEEYWDGGYSSNPPLRPLIEAGAPADLLLVRTTPLERPQRPVGAAAVAQRATEITFGVALRGELRSLALAQELLAGMADVPAPLARLRDARLHVIGAEAEFQAMQGGSRQDPSWSFLSEMRELGHRAADQWLGENLSSVGHRSSMDLSRFVGPGAGIGPETEQARVQGQAEGPAADAVSEDLYASSNGDRWRLVRDAASGREFVRHEANLASGGHVTELETAAFLGRGGTGPEHAALRSLLGGRDEQGSPAAQVTASVTKRTTAASCPAARSAPPTTEH